MGKSSAAIVILALACLIAPPRSRAATVEIPAARDVTLIETTNGQKGDALGSGLRSGRTGQPQGALRRVLIAFDVASRVPGGATVSDATLELCVTDSGGEFVETVNLFRLQADWGEGSSVGSGGGGAPSTVGDATWIHTFYDSGFWDQPGGDFAATPSATALVGDNGFFNWGSSTRMVADVQSWLDDPSENFGWILIGNENGRVILDQPEPRTVKAFASREHPDCRPVLSLRYLTSVDADEDDEDEDPD